MEHRIFQTDNSWTPLILRVFLSLVIFPHGYQKIVNFANAMDHMTHEYGLPWLIALLVVIIELFAPILLIAGAASRVMAFLIGIVMLGAIPYHWNNGFFMNWFGNQAGEGFEFHLLAIGIAIALAISGGGKYSVDKEIIVKEKGKS